MVSLQQVVLDSTTSISHKFIMIDEHYHYPTSHSNFQPSQRQSTTSIKSFIKTCFFLDVYFLSKHVSLHEGRIKYLEVGGMIYRRWIYYI